MIGPPLQGSSYISADSCCDATRHAWAVLPINGGAWVAQRMAVDWEQLDDQGRIYSGPHDKLESYTIFGTPVLAVTDAVVVDCGNDQPEQTPGKYPEAISPAQADGNFVILDLGEHRYALYAHMQPSSVRVHKGDHVTRGQVVGLVGNTGNSLVPHLHFQVMDRPSSLASNGLPYEIDSFRVTGSTPGTAAFDEGEERELRSLSRLCLLRKMQGKPCPSISSSSSFRRDKHSHGSREVRRPDACLRRVSLKKKRSQIEGSRNHCQVSICCARPLLRRKVAVKLNPVVVRIAQIERVADTMVCGAFERNVRLNQAVQCIGKFCPGRIENRQMI